ncbi:MAG: bifunctional precorrin-2 dehydrogenase/sirohydrochlorin ferrochelatase [bacterium]
MKTFPVNLVLQQMPILVVGGGAVAEEKVAKLLHFLPAITLVSPAINEYFEHIVNEGKVRYINDVYRKEYLEGQLLVVAATNDSAVHETIHEDTHQKGILLNTVDVPSLCDFIFPAMISGEHFVISISTNGKVAGYSRIVREELEQSIKAEDEVVEAIEKLRNYFKRKYHTVEERKGKLMKILRELEEQE